MPDDIVHLYLFRSDDFSRSPNTVVAVAPLAAVFAVYGSGGLAGEGGLSDAFGGAAVYKNDETQACFIGVWGSRNVAKFKADLKTNLKVEVLKEAPDARLRHWGSSKVRSKPTGLAGMLSRL